METSETFRKFGKIGFILHINYERNKIHLDRVFFYTIKLVKDPFFHRKSATFVILRNTEVDCISMHNF